MCERFFTPKFNLCISSSLVFSRRFEMCTNLVILYSYYPSLFIKVITKVHPIFAEQNHPRKSLHEIIRRLSFVVIFPSSLFLQWMLFMFRLNSLKRYVFDHFVWFIVSFESLNLGFACKLKNETFFFSCPLTLHAWL